jgi:hypothetical protein
MINDNFLTEMAKALAGESYVVPAYLAFGSDVITESTTTTSLSGEFGTRGSLTDSRSSQTVTFTGLRLGATIATSAGETLNAMSLNSSSTSGSHLSEVLLSSILHTTAYDIEVVWQITTARQTS